MMKSDRVVESTILLQPPTGAAQVAGRAVVPPKQWENHTITLPIEPGTLAEMDQLAVMVWTPPGTNFGAAFRISMAAHSAGLEKADYHSMYYRALKGGGWSRVEFPLENCLIYGMSNDWVRARELQITFNQVAEIHLGEVLAERRLRPQGPRLTDAEFLAELDLDMPELAQVRLALDEGRANRALKALNRHLRKRKHPLAPYGTLSDHLLEESVITRADEICEGLIDGQPIGLEVNWRANPIGYLEWMHAFNRQFFMLNLLAAYRLTKDEKYTARLAYLVESWIQQNPGPVGNSGGGDPAWETLSVACRLAWVWPYVLEATRNSPSFDFRTRIDVMKSWWEQIEHLRQWHGGSNNWFIIESEAVFNAGVLFPEFKSAGQWREEGMARLMTAMHEQVFHDGMQYELAPAYHKMCARCFADPCTLAELNGIELPPGFRQTLERMYEYVLHLTRPDFTLPSLNDSRAYDENPAVFLHEGAELFHREDMRWAASGGKKGQPPQEGSRGFDCGGHYIMREGWGADGVVLVADAGPLGAAHQHEDKLSFDFSAYGECFIVDPGIAGYMDDSYTRYFRDTAAHNTVMVGGQPQRHSRVPKRCNRSVAGENVWETTERYDLLVSAYDEGYGEGTRRIEATHRRAFVFIKPDIFLLFDEITGQGRRRIDTLFHFAPMQVRLEQKKGLLRTTRLGLSNMELLCLPVSSMPELRVLCGETKPLQGWVASSGGRSRGPLRILPAPCLVASTRSTLPVRQGWLMAPYRSGPNSGLSVRWWNEEDDSTVVRVMKNGAVYREVRYRWEGAVKLLHENDE